MFEGPTPSHAHEESETSSVTQQPKVEESSAAEHLIRVTDSQGNYIGNARNQDEVKQMIQNHMTEARENA
ncbi:MAG: hypothetical protein ABIT47_02375 [Candidatus Paceibacterota bacterium]